MFLYILVCKSINLSILSFQHLLDERQKWLFLIDFILAAMTAVYVAVLGSIIHITVTYTMTLIITIQQRCKIPQMASGFVKMIRQATKLQQRPTF